MTTEASLKSVGEKSGEKAWNSCLSVIREKVNGQSFKTWFETIVPLKLEDEELTIQVPGKMFYEVFEENFHALLKSTMTAVIGPRARLSYSVVRTKDEITPVEAVLQQESVLSSGTNGRSMREASQEDINFFKANAEKFQSQLNSEYSFENLIKGSCNDLAIAAAQSVSEKPVSNTYNPLVIYGESGLGKTHILQAIGNYATNNKKANFIVYVPAEKFTLEMVNALQERRISEFTAFFRKIDLLIMDDIHSIAGKQKTQEELFNIFNVLHHQNKQIVLSCDRPIKDLRDIEERLISRFQWGLAADIQVPDYETRLAILHKKMETMQTTEDTIPYAVLDFIAKNVDTNVRALEGCIIKLLASASINRHEINLETSKEILRDFIRKRELTVSPVSIERVVCSYYKISQNDIRGKSRKQDIVHARQVAMYLMKTCTGASLKTIGLQLGGRDHSTVIHACNAVEDRLNIYLKDRSELEEIKRELLFNAD